VFDALWPTYNHHGNHTPTYFGALVPEHARFQLLCVDRRTDRLVARGRSIPFCWDGSLEDLPAGIDAVGLRAVESRSSATTLSALAAEVATNYQGQGLSSLLLQSMVDVARANGLDALVAPVRPSWKDRYPLIPIDRYAGWRREDGLPFDPWLRVHSRLGAHIVRPEARSLEITAPVTDWQEWIDMPLPDDGEYVFPEGLAPLTVTGAIGSYWEPNIWMLHNI
jgi:GNAT superfamily N-acetyltransferase